LGSAFDPAFEKQIECGAERRNGSVQMPVARYFVWVGGVLLALLFIADACLPELPAGKAIDASRPVIRIHSERKWPERIVFDTSAPMPHVAAAVGSLQVKHDETAAIIPDRAREALAQLQSPNSTETQAKRKKQETRPLQKLARRHVARPPPGFARWPQYAWFGDRVW
jgi:hypothetical protein